MAPVPKGKCLRIAVLTSAVVWSALVQSVTPVLSAAPPSTAPTASPESMPASAATSGPLPQPTTAATAVATQVSTVAPPTLAPSPVPTNTTAATPTAQIWSLPSPTPTPTGITTLRPSRGATPSATPRTPSSSVGLTRRQGIAPLTKCAISRPCRVRTPTMPVNHVTRRSRSHPGSLVRSAKTLLPRLFKPGIGEPVTCTGDPKPRSRPFLSAPFSGYAEIASYFDHDQPDYAVDGTIILASGIIVHGSAQSEGGFPAYWAPTLRQYINYDGHNGYDYDISYQPVLAAANGTVSYAGWETSNPYYGYGQMILIRHRSGYITLYGHLSQILVKVGQHVLAGQQIAVSGTTGNSTGPHLHFTVYHNCHVVDPYGWVGAGRDPLHSFNGEDSVYLWRRGEAPLILNPLPGWPDFGSGRLPRVPATPTLRSPARISVTRLLLLRVPQTSSSAPSVSLASFEQQLTDEHQQLFTLLDVLKSEGLVQSYTLIPNAGAIRVRGTIDSQQLTGLPGVASILGARPKDLASADYGLAHALNASMSPQPAPSLFPSTYLDSEWSWRLTLSIEENGPYVLGYGRAGATVRVRVSRDGSRIASATTAADASDGAFAVYLSDAAGHALSLQPGDAVQVACDGKSTTVPVVMLSVHANPVTNRVYGEGPAGAGFQITSIQGIDGRRWTAIAQTAEAKASTTSYATHLGGHLTAGDVVVASLLDEAGNTTFTWSRVPGLAIQEGSDTLTGWSNPGTSWQVTVYRSHRWRASAHGTALSDGYLTARMVKGDGVGYMLEPGDTIEFSPGGGRLQRAYHTRLPRLTGRLKTGARAFAGWGPASSVLYIRSWDDAAEGWQVARVTTDRMGRYRLRLARPAVLGDAVDCTYVDQRGDTVEGAWAVRGAVMHLGTNELTGRSSPGETLVVRVSRRNRRGSVHLVGVAVTMSDPRTGLYSARVLPLTSTRVRFREDDRVTVSDGTVTSSYVVTPITITTVNQGDTLRGWVRGRGHVAVVLWSGTRELGQLVTPVTADGHYAVNLRNHYPLGPGDRIEAVYGSSTAGASETDITLAGSRIGGLSRFNRDLRVLSWAVGGS